MSLERPWKIAGTHLGPQGRTGSRPVWMLFLWLLAWPALADPVFTPLDGSLYYRLEGGSPNLGSLSTWDNLALDTDGEFPAVSETHRVEDGWHVVQTVTEETLSASINTTGDSLKFSCSMSTSKSFSNYFSTLFGVGGIWHNPGSTVYLIYSLDFELPNTTKVTLLHEGRLRRRETGAMEPVRYNETSVDSRISISGRSSVFHAIDDGPSSLSGSGALSLDQGFGTEPLEPVILPPGRYTLQLYNRAASSSYANAALPAGIPLLESVHWGARIGTSVGLPARTAASMDCTQELRFEPVDSGLLPVSADLLGEAAVALQLGNLASAPGVKGLSTDDASLALLYKEVGANRNVTFSIEYISPSSLGTLHPLSTDYPAIQRDEGSYLLDAAYIEAAGKSYAVALLKAPETSATSIDKARSQEAITVTVRQSGSEIGRIPYRLRAPPLLTMHGIWSEPSAWAGLKQYLEANQYPADIHLGGYEAHKSRHFSSSEIQGELAVHIAKALNQARLDGWISTRVDVVAHSMGGLVTRRRAARTGYRNPANFGVGDIGRLITVATPHLGSYFANWLNQRRDANLDLSVLNEPENFFGRLLKHAYLLGHPGPFLLDLKYAMQYQGKPIDQGGVDGLRVAAENAAMLASPSQLPFRAIQAERPSSSLNVTGLNLALESFDGKFLPEQPDTTQSVLRESTLGLSDAIVQSTSQWAGAAQRAIIPGFSHSSLLLPLVDRGDTGINEAQPTYARILCWLTESACQASALQPPAGAVKKASTLAASNFEVPDLSALTQVSPGDVGLSIQHAGSIMLGKSNPVTLTASNRQVERVIALTGVGVRESMVAPYVIDVEAASSADQDLAFLVLFDDGHYAIQALSLPVVAPDVIGAIDAPDRIDLPYVGDTLSMVAKAIMPDPGFAFVLGSAATYQVDDPQVATVTTDGLVTATGIGHALLSVSYLDVTKVVAVSVLGELDSDFDGIPDWYEARYDFLDPLDPADAARDQDGDGDSNLEEYRQGTPPDDRDGDQVADGQDNCPLVANPDQADRDSDGSGDACDDDSDNDGLSNSDEINLYLTNPGDADSDGDGLPDGYEVEQRMNPRVVDSQLDNDGDGATNRQEYRAGTDPNDPASVPHQTFPQAILPLLLN